MSNIGSVSITVDADASAVPSEVEKATKGPLAKVGETMGKALSSSLAAAIDPKAATSALQSGFTGALSRIRSAAVSSVSPITQLGKNFTSGFQDATAAASSFSGRLGSLGGVARKALNPAITGVQNFASGFQSSTAALSSFSGRLGSLGGVARTAWNAVAAGASIISPAVSKALSGITSAASSTWGALRSGASATWDAIRSGASSAFASIGNAMRGTLETAAKATGAVVAGTIGVALTKGFTRLESIDTAQAKLTGLGITGDNLAATMTSATNAVRGTAFGLGEAASAAASFAAAGVPIDGMERSLKILASTAAVAGTDMTEMGTIFGKVAATGKVNGEVLQQLAERGVPALSLLADQLGVTAEEVSKMVSAGEVDFETFQSAMEAGLGPAAAAMGQSFSGMMANVGASLGRLGATAQKPIFEALKSVMPGLINLFDQVGKVVEPVAAAIGERLAPAAEKLGGFLSALDFSDAASGAGSFLPALAPLLPVLGAFAGMLGPMLAQIPVLGGLFSGLTGPVGLVAGAFAALLAFDPQTLLNGFQTIQGTLPGMLTGLVDGITTLIPAMVARLSENVPIFINGVGQIIRQVVPAIATALPSVINGAAALISELVPGMLSALATQATLIGSALLDALLGAVPAVALAIPQIVSALAALIPEMVDALLSAIPAILDGALSLFSAIATALPVILPQIIAAIVAMIPKLATALLTAIPLIIQAALSLFSGVITGLTTALPLIIAAVLEILPQLVTTLLGMLPTIIDSALQLFLGIVTGLLTALPQIIIAVLEMLPEIISTLLGMIPQLIDAAVQLFTGLVEAIPVILPQLVDAIFSLGPVLVDTLISLIPDLLQAGVDLIGGLIEGLWEAAGSLGEALLDIAKDAIGGFLDFLGIASPSKLFMGFGENVGQGLVNGLKAMTAPVSKAMDGLASTVGGDFDGPRLGPTPPPPPGSGLGGTGVGGGAGGGSTPPPAAAGTSIVQNYDITANNVDPVAVGAAIADRSNFNLGRAA